LTRSWVLKASLFKAFDCELQLGARCRVDALTIEKPFD
jgi:hypothetical protein